MGVRFNSVTGSSYNWISLSESDTSDTFINMGLIAGIGNGRFIFNIWFGSMVGSDGTVDVFIQGGRSQTGVFDTRIISGRYVSAAVTSIQIVFFGGSGRSATGDFTVYEMVEA